MELEAKKEENLFYKIPLVSTIILSVSVILSLIYLNFNGGLKSLPLFYSVFFILALVSQILMRVLSFRVGLHMYILTIFTGALFLDIFNFIDVIIFMPLFFYTVIMVIFLLEKPVNIIYTFLFYLVMIYRVIFKSEQDLVPCIIEILIVTLSIYVMVEVKWWLIKLNAYKIESLTKMHNATLRILGKVSEVKDEETTFHLMRVEILIEILTQEMQKKRTYAGYLTEKYIEDIKSAAFLHDIGKIGIPDNILNKEGKLTDEEFQIIKSHTLIGFNVLEEARKEIKDESLYDLAQEMARHHHEKWDGSGYPDGLKGEDIPLSARVMALVDVYDALMSKRPYKEAYSHGKSIEIIRESSGTHFDPIIVDVFMSHSEEIFERIQSYLPS